MEGIMAIDSGYFGENFENMSTDDVAALLVKLYADYRYYCGSSDDNYARAVGIAIRMLTD